MPFGLTSPRFDRPAPHRDQRGIIMSSPLALVSAGAVLLSGVAYFATSPARPQKVTLTYVHQETASQVTITPSPDVLPVPNRAKTYVVVFNNSSIAGLAGRTATELAGDGWNVVGSDNWYGTIPATTVYFPTDLKPEAELLADDLGISRVKPAIDPMQGDRLTVILTGDVQ